jgi:deoxyribodipyrimidine photo-lyase
VLDDFFAGKYGRYAAERNEPEDPANSGFSPYLHWGFLSAHEVFARVARRRTGRPTGWGPSPPASARGGGG